jgi:hypothetical protein
MYKVLELLHVQYIVGTVIGLALSVCSVLARQPSRAADSLLRSRGGGGDGDPPCVLATGGEDLYI